jgi:hypothetical protein
VTRTAATVAPRRARALIQRDFRPQGGEPRIGVLHSNRCNGRTDALHNSLIALASGAWADCTTRSRGLQESR